MERTSATPNSQSLCQLTQPGSELVFSDGKSVYICFNQARYINISALACACDHGKGALRYVRVTSGRNQISVVGERSSSLQGPKCAHRVTATQKSEESNGCFPALIDATDDTAKTLGKFGWFAANICEMQVLTLMHSLAWCVAFSNA